MKRKAGAILQEEMESRKVGRGYASDVYRLFAVCAGIRAQGLVFSSYGVPRYKIALLSQATLHVRRLIPVDQLSRLFLVNVLTLVSHLPVSSSHLMNGFLAR